MLEQRVDCAGRAVDHVQNAGRKTSFEEELGQARAAEGRAVRWLEDEGVARDDGQREHPERDHYREVEGRDACADADRIAVQVLVDAARDVPQRPSLQEGRRAACEVDDLDATPHFAAGLVERLAVVARDEGGELLEVVLEQRLETEHEPDAVHYRGARPGAKGFRGCTHRGIDLARVRQRHVLDHFGGGWVVHRQRPGVLSR